MKSTAGYKDTGKMHNTISTGLPGWLRKTAAPRHLPPSCTPLCADSLTRKRCRAAQQPLASSSWNARCACYAFQPCTIQNTSDEHSVTLPCELQIRMFSKSTHARGSALPEHMFVRQWSLQVMVAPTLTLHTGYWPHLEKLINACCRTPWRIFTLEPSQSLSLLTCRGW